MKEKKDFMSITLPKALIEELKVWKMAYALTYGKSVSYEDMIRNWIDTFSEGSPEIRSEFEAILMKNPELSEKIGKFNGKDENRI